MMNPGSFHRDDRLMQRLREGDKKAFIEIYQKYCYEIFLIAYVQDMFTCFYTSNDEKKDLYFLCMFIFNGLGFLPASERSD